MCDGWLDGQSHLQVSVDDGVDGWTVLGGLVQAIKCVMK